MDSRLLEEHRVEEKRHDAESRGVSERVLNGRRTGRWKVELRDPMLPENRLWVGTFDTREMAKKAYDVVLHYLGRPTYYRISYPAGYFSDIKDGLPQDAQKYITLLKEKAKEYSSRVPGDQISAASAVDPADQDTAIPSNMPILGERAVELQCPPQSPTRGLAQISCDFPAKPAESENCEPSPTEWYFPDFKVCSPHDDLWGKMGSDGLGASTYHTTSFGEGLSQQHYPIHFQLNATSPVHVTPAESTDWEALSTDWPQDYYRQPGGDPFNSEDNDVRATSPNTTPSGEGSSHGATINWLEDYYKQPGGSPSNLEHNVVCAISPATTPFSDHASSDVVNLRKMQQDQEDVKHHFINTIDSSLAALPRSRTLRRNSLPEFSLDKLEGEEYGPCIPIESVSK